VAIGLLASGCATMSEEESQLQRRQIQTREYDTTDTVMVLKAVIATLQDEGFIIKEADKDLGLIVALREGEVANIIDGSFATMSGIAGFGSLWDSDADVECSANVQGYGDKVRVRVNFRKKLKNVFGGPVTVGEIDDPRFYQDFFSKIDKGIFIEKEGI
jgi:hypothetical protein